MSQDQNTAGTSTSRPIPSPSTKREIKPEPFSKWQFLPPWTMPVATIGVVLYTLCTTKKWRKIKQDLKEPRFVVILVLVFAFLFLVKDPNVKRSRYATSSAIIAGLAAYFGHLDMPLVALFLAGTFAYYTYREFSQDTPGVVTGPL